MKRQTLYLLLLFSLFLPFLVVVGCALNYLRADEGQMVLGIACVALVIAVASGFRVVKLFEKGMQEKVAHLVQAKVETLGVASHTKLERSEEEQARLKALLEESRRNYEHQVDLLQSSGAKAREQILELELEIERRKEENYRQKIAYDDLAKECHHLHQEVEQLGKEGGEQIHSKEVLLAEYQQTIHEQRGIIEKKQRYITKLESKVRDQIYEIRSLLQLGPSLPATHPLDLPEQKEDLSRYYLPHPQSPIENTPPYDLSLLLQKYVERTEKFPTLAFKEGQAPRFLDLSMEGFAIDLRRLFDSFRDETTGIVFIYSQVENKILFVNQQVKTLLGWSPEKMMKEFPSLVIAGFEEWQGQLSQLSQQSEVSCEIHLRNKNGQSIPFQCFMGTVKTGPFTHHVIGLLAPASATV